MRSAVKLVAINALVLFVIFNVVIWSICIGVSVYGVFTGGPQFSAFRKAVRKANLPNYANIDWARTHFAEFESLSTQYISYIGWRRGPFDGKTIKLVGPYNVRQSIGPADAGKPSVYYFGGSTMWGSGADDANTIPSLVTQLSGMRSTNYGETAYSAHQSLTLLMQLLQEGNRPDVVVFYDGVNDVIQKCRSELTPKSHAREARIRAALAATTIEREYGLSYMARPLMAMAASVSQRLFRAVRDDSKHFNCHSDAAKAQQIADNLLQDWEMARRLVESYNGKFIGILQPVAYYSDTKLDHIKLNNLEKKQYQAVYPLIKQRLAERPGLRDFTDVLNKPEYIFIDFCHLSPNGNRYVAQRIVQTLAN